MNQIRSEDAPEYRITDSYQLSIRLAEFCTGLKSLAPLSKKPTSLLLGKAAIEFDGVFAVMICPGAEITMNAAGVWPGRASFSANLVLGQIAVPPTTDPVVIRTDSRRIWVAGASVPCNWQPQQ